MDRYKELALELICEMDKKHKGPPHEEVGAVVRGEMAVLRLLDKEKRSMSAGDISRLLSMTTSRVAAVLNSLQKKEMILRDTDAEDKRRVLVTLTDSGRDFCKERREQAISDMTALLAGLGEEDAAHFVRIMKRIHEIMPGPPHMRKREKEDEPDE